MNGRTSNIKVGLFILASLAIFLVFVFVLGGQENLLQRSYKIQTSFNNVAGLAEGAAVRLSGLKIGTVKEIQFPEDTNKNFIVVVMDVSEVGIKRIGPDAVATIRTEGLLGDKYIEILRGSKPPPEEIPETLQISSYTPPEFQKLLGQSEELIDNIIRISKSLDEIVNAFGKEENIENITRTIASLRRSVEAIETEPGVLHTLIYGKKGKSGEDFQATLEKLDQAVTNLNELLKDLRDEEGVLTALIYDQELRDKLSSALTNINSITEELSKEGGIFAELQETVSNFKDISEKLEGGEGTLGALINDPTLYDNLKGVLGEAERSRFVRAAVQYLIENKSKESDQTQ